MYAASKLLRRALLPVAVLLGAVACHDIVNLEEHPETFVDPNSYFKNGTEAITAVNGIYAPLMTWDAWISPAFQEVTCEATDMHCPAWWAFGRTGANPGSWFAGRTWGSFYSVIRRSNDILGQLDKVTLDSTLESRLRGEAHFLRGYAYFELVRRYGQVPLRLDPYLPDGSYGDRAPAPMADVYHAITADLNAAAEELPADYSSRTYTAADAGRPTKWSALGLLSKTYLTMAGAEANLGAVYYDSALIAARAVRDGHWAQLDPDYMHVFDYHSQASNPEILWQVGATHQENTGMEAATFSPPEYDLNGGGAGGFVQMREPFYETYEANDVRVKPGYAIAGFYRESYSQAQLPTGLPTYFKTYLPDTLQAKIADWRTQVGWTWTDICDTNGVRQYRVAASGLSSADSVTIGVTPRVFTLKYVDREALTKSQNSNNPIILRYADVLLILAEAANEVGGPTTEARNALNAVRARAELQPIETANPAAAGKDAFRQAVWLERRHELYAEFQDWFDEKREGVWLDFMNGVKPAYPGSSQPFNTSNGAAPASASDVCRPRQEYQRWLPIPSAEIGANHLIHQNPGY